MRVNKDAKTSATSASSAVSYVGACLGKNYRRERRGRREMGINEVTRKIIGASIAVHRELGPGLLESAYEACLVFELLDMGLLVERQLGLPVSGYRIDLRVERRVIVELKAVQALQPIHAAQLLSYLKLSGCEVGLLINFNVRRLKDGIRRLVNNFSEPPPRSLRTPR